METFGNFQAARIPNEIWDMIFCGNLDVLRDKTSLLKATQASKTWNTFLHQKKPILAFSQVLPHIVPYIGSTGLWNSRLVCRSWRDDVDTYLENPEARDQHYHIIPKFCMQFIEFQNFYRKVGQICEHPGNPFPGRSLTVHLTRPIKPIVNSILRDFGEHLWHLHLIISEGSIRFAQFLGECLQWTPNLKELCIEGEIIPKRRRVSSRIAFSGECWEEGFDLVHFLRSNNSFPHIKSLEALEVRIFNPIPKLIARSLLLNMVRLTDHARQLKSLKLDMGDVRQFMDLLPTCVNLKELEISLSLTPRFSLIQYSDILKSPIQTLAFCVGKEIEAKVEWPRFLRKIQERLSTTLQKFYLFQEN